MSTKPRKPSAPMSVLNFGKNGSVTPITESLPSGKDDLEFVVASQFLAALSSRFGRTLKGLERGDEWPDFWTAEGEVKIGLEVVEVVDPEHVKTGLAHRVPRWVPVEYPKTLLAKAMQGKVGKRYPRPTNGKVWLTLPLKNESLAE